MSFTSAFPHEEEAFGVSSVAARLTVDELHSSHNLCDQISQNMSSSVRVKRRRTEESDTEGSVSESELANKADAVCPVPESEDGNGNPEPISVSGESSAPVI